MTEGASGVMITGAGAGFAAAFLTRAFAGVFGVVAVFRALVFLAVDLGAAVVDGMQKQMHLTS